MRAEVDMYRGHLSRLNEALLDLCLYNGEIKDDDRSRAIFEQSRGIRMAMDAYDICVKEETEEELASLLKTTPAPVEPLVKAVDEKH
jgi:hypothetical protein